MLFNSYQFLLVFFPIVLAIYFITSWYDERASVPVMLVASLFFYGWWDVRFIPLLGLSILGNYGFGCFLFEAIERRQFGRANLLMATGVALNLVVLGMFKYAQFFVTNVNAVTGANFTFGTIILPLGISFFTFEQIGFLLDLRRGDKIKPNLCRYAVFVSFFPRLVAGPILRYGEIVPQLEGRERPLHMTRDLAVGLTIFSIGLVKKSLLADGIAPYATPVFGAAAAGEPLTLFVAWGGALAYTFQLYFDFSGYSDMAIGAARCFGVRFPMNFFSPYRATSIIEFWRRWHITLSRFLRDYLYIGLGGNRRGSFRRYANLFVTMLLGGLWHGAAWTFILWGGLHGLYLMINHAWLAIAGRNVRLAAFRQSPLASVFGWALTFLAVVVAWVFFRAPSLNAAVLVLQGMAGMNGATIPAGLAFALQPLHGLLAAMRVTFAEGSGTVFVETYLWLLTLLGVTLLLPSTQEALARFEPILEMAGGHALSTKGETGLRPFGVRWALSPGCAVATGVLAFLGIISITRVSEFLYWQF